MFCLIKGWVPFICKTLLLYIHSTLARIQESKINSQLKHYLANNNILSEIKSGFSSVYGTIPTAMLVSNDVVYA